MQDEGWPLDRAAAANGAAGRSNGFAGALSSQILHSNCISKSVLTIFDKPYDMSGFVSCCLSGLNFANACTGEDGEGAFAFERPANGAQQQRRWMAVGRGRLLSLEDSMLVEYNIASRAPVGVVFLSIGALCCPLSGSVQSS